MEMVQRKTEEDFDIHCRGNKCKIKCEVQDGEDSDYC